ncbi:MAG: DNA polymerase Y family protein, partial [Acidimicrobiales bacterium]
LTAVPRTLSVGAGPPVGVVDWAGPWTCDERWWDRRAGRRCARLQVACADRQAHLLVREAGRWRVEATYA